jgi:hypothetical protein
MMSLLKFPHLVLGLGLLIAQSAQCASAQPRFYVGEDDPDAFLHPRIPDANGCVKLCLKDDSPCDPDYFKHADGRCTNNTDNRH